MPTQVRGQHSEIGSPLPPWDVEMNSGCEVQRVFLSTGPHCGIDVHILITSDRIFYIHMTYLSSFENCKFRLVAHLKTSMLFS